jgi:malic enzyme
MALAAARALAGAVPRGELSAERILPRLDEPGVAAEVAAATGVAAQQAGLARVAATAEELRQRAASMIAAAQESTRLLTTGRNR